MVSIIKKSKVRFLRILDVWNCIIRIFVVYNCMISIFGVSRSTRENFQAKVVFILTIDNGDEHCILVFFKVFHEVFWFFTQIQ